MILLFTQTKVFPYPYKRQNTTFYFKAFTLNWIKAVKSAWLPWWLPGTRKVLNHHNRGRKCVTLMVGVTRSPLLVLPVRLRPMYIPGWAADS